MLSIKTSFVTLIIALSVSLAVAQSKNFVSPDNRFTVALPNNSASIRVVNPYPTVKGGNQFDWSTPQGQFLIGYVDFKSSPKNSKMQLEKSADKIIQGTINYGGKLISKREISYDNYSGLEIRFLLSKELMAVTRFYLVKNRLYNLNSGWSAREDGAAQLKVLDSFKLLDLKERSVRKLGNMLPSLKFKSER